MREALIQRERMENDDAKNLLLLPFNRIDTDWERFRLIHPATERAMVRSIEQYGQITPIIVGAPLEDRYLLVDGFKRFRACQKLGRETVKACVLKKELRALKVAMIQMNNESRSMASLEEAMIVQALYREDNLSQVAISMMVGRHKSWVCRRIAMIERLSEEVLEQVRLGLVHTSICRELSGLPHGNQAKALKTIQKYRMTCQEAARLVYLLKESPRWSHDVILTFPHAILSDREPDRPSDKDAPAASRILVMELSKIEKQCETLWTSLKKEVPGLLSSAEQKTVESRIQGIEAKLKMLKSLPHLKENPDEPLF